ncbi:uncharacterized protein [Chanodichthys erythropterus]|uniref:uncharacterized protein isoform X2 n=1 Tax=Chanodichthys erythropterus TaxID=933992 RepID=UPI00351E5547
MKLFFSLPLLLCCLLDHGFLCVSVGVSVSVIEGDSVTLNTDDEIKQEEIKWYFNDICIAQISGDQSKSKICTDDHCEDADGRFRDRLDLNCQTGSLTITNTRTTDSGEYHLEIINGSISEKIFSVTVHGASGVDTDRVSVVEGDSVALHTGVETKHQDRIRWYFNDIRIAQINRDFSKICTDVRCNKGTERFRDRLKLDHQTGSLTIMNIIDTVVGVYQLQISSGNSDSEKTFIIALYGVSAAERDEMKRKSVKEGESVTLDPGVIKKLNDSMTWYFNEILITEITGDQSKICTDVQCDERFRDRLKLDHQTGSLTITNTRNTDSGEYKLLINSSRFSIIRSVSVSVTALPDSGLSSAAAAGIVAVVVLPLATVGGIYYHHWKSRRRKAIQKRNRRMCDDHQENGALEEVPLNRIGTP